MTEAAEYVAEADTPEKLPKPLPPVLTRWWVWCLLASGVLLGLVVVNIQHPMLDSFMTLGSIQLPDAYLIAVLWVGANPGLVAGTSSILAMVGGVGWGLERVGGARGALAGAALSLLLLLGVPVGLGITDWYFWYLSPNAWSQWDDLFSLGGPVLLGLLVVWSWAASSKGKWQNLGRGLLLWALVALPMAGSFWVAGRRIASNGDQAHGALIGVVWVLGLFPALSLLWFRPRRPGLARASVWKGAAACLAVALALPQFTPRARPALPPDFFTAGIAEAADEPAENRFFPSFSALGLDKGKWNDGRMMAQAEGVARQLPMPPPGHSRWSIGAAAFPPYSALKNDRVNLTASRRYLQDLLAIDPNVIDALVLLVMTASDPLARFEDVEALASIPEKIPAYGGIGGLFAVRLYARGQTELGDATLAKAQPALTRATSLLEQSGTCISPMADNQCETSPRDIRRALLHRDWPLFAPPHNGTLTVFWDPGAEDNLVGDLLIAPLPLLLPDMPTYLDSDRTWGPWSVEGLVQLHPAVGEQTVLTGMPVGRYALEVAFREHKHPGLEVWVVGLPREEIVIGPGQWDWE
ncbi:hypothetical protein IIA16_04755, partial [bacterium]|nr:hypothetical protein [bacterium]